jgi:uncharacterized membrane protein
MSKKNNTRFISKTFAQGIAVVLPVVGAGYVLTWAARDTEKAIKSILLAVIPESLYIPGLGIAVFVAFTFMLGLLMYPWITRIVLNTADNFFRKVPLFGSVYSPIRDFLDLFGGDMADQLGDPVMIQVPGTEMETLGFVTRRTGDNLPEGMLPDDHIVVYVQWSSQIGGYCFVVPEKAVRPLDLSVEEGMRWALTAGLSAPKSQDQKS